jgi:carbon monoxide dehydrogenase subunit G
MTELKNQITIRAPRSVVWQALTDLGALADYDPGVKTVTLVDGPASGLGAQRRCELRPKGWFIEQVVTWEADSALAFQLQTCSLPVASLRHDYTLTEDAGATRLEQVMTYQLKYGGLGRALDTLVLRRQWDRGIKGFLAGLQQHIEHVTV